MLTHSQDLRTGKPVWSSPSQLDISATALNRDVHSDVVIIGAGVSGALIAEELTRVGCNVIMLDRRGPIQGATAASTALLIHEIDIPLILLKHKLGQARAIHAWRRSRLGLESLIARIKELDINCGYERVPSLLLSGDILNGHGLQAEALARNAAGLPAEYLAAPQVKDRFGISSRTAILSQQCATVDPVHMTAGFLQTAAARGLRIYAPITATHLRRDGKNWAIETQEGPTLYAQYVIYACGYEIPKMIKTRKHKIKSTWVIATRPQSQKIWPERCVIWEASETYLYLRADNDGRIICGGEDEDFSNAAHRDSLIAQKAARLEKKLGKLFPEVDNRMQYSWAGSFGSSSTGLPSIGQIPGMKNVYAIMAYGGNGISFSRIAAEIIATSIIGGRDPDADLFAFS